MERNILALVKKRLTNREDSEHTQTFVRAGMGMAWLIYILWLSLDAELVKAAFITPYVYLACCLFNLAWIVVVPRPLPVRRYLNILLDTSFMSYALYLLDANGAPLFGAYLFLTFGYGFRFGNQYLFTSAFMSVTGLLMVTKYSQYWQSEIQFAYGIIITIVVLTAYVSTLISRLHNAVNEARAANEAKSQFLANMSHEIRTPLNGVIGMSALLSGTEMNTTQKDYSATINASAKTLLALINDVLDISKIEAGKVTIEHINFDLHALVNTTARMLAPQAQDKNLDFNIHISLDTPFLLKGDDQHLRQVIINLIGNAIKFTREGSIEIYVYPVSIDDTRTRIRFEVIDSGIGIADDAKPKLFDKFTQADSSTTRKFGGTGLGMAIAKQLVETMNGQIDFESVLGQGSTFWFELGFDRQKILSEEKHTMHELHLTKALVIKPGDYRDETIDQNLHLFGIDIEYVDDAENALQAMSIEDHADYTIVIVFRKLLDTDPILFIQEACSINTQAGFILVSDEDKDFTCKNPFLNAGYCMVIENNPDRTRLYRAIHAIVGGNSITGHAENGIECIPQSFHERQELKILVGEDNETNQKVIRNILEYGKHEVTIVANGEQVLDELEKNNYDLLIIDMQMPIMGGLEAVKIYRFTNTDSTLPIIMLTANATSESIDACKEAKLDAYLIKPVEPDKLLNTITSVIYNREQTTQMKKEMEFSVVNIHDPENLPLIDFDVLQSIFRMSKNETFMHRLIDGFIEDSVLIIQNLKDSDSSDFDQVADLAHTLDGSSRTIGARRLSRAADLVYKITQKKEGSSMPNAINNLMSIFDQTCDELELFMESNSSSIQKH